MANEYYSSAQATKQHWERALSHQRSLSHQLQENFETLAKQMHGLENEARRASKQGMNLTRGELDESFQFPVTMTTTSSIASSDSSAISVDLKSTNGNNRHSKKGVSFDLPLSPPIAKPIYITNEEEVTTPIEEIEDEDDQFYDAEEGSNDMADTLQASKKALHKRTESSISMNEAHPVPPSHVPIENLPTTNSEGTMAVRQTHTIMHMCDNISFIVEVPPMPSWFYGQC